MQERERWCRVRITVDLDEDTLAEVLELTGETQKSPALAKAIVEFVRRRRAKEFGSLIREGYFDYPDSGGLSPGGEDSGNPVPPLLPE